MLEEKESIVALATALAGVRSADTTFTRAYASLDEIEQLIFGHKESFGGQNALFQQGCEEFILLCNTAAIQQLPHATEVNGTLQPCGDLLVRAEQHTRRTGYLRSMTDGQHVTGRLQLRLLSLNNLACYHKQVGKPLAAIGCLEEALEIQLRQLADPSLCESSTDDSGAPENAVALTYLNLSAVLSQLRRHDAAAEHARCAIELLQQAQRCDCIDANVLVVAYYNLAVEAEHLGDRSRVATTIDKGLATAQRYGLDKHSNDVVRLLDDMRRSNTAKSPRRVVAPSMRPPSPRTLRNRG